MRHLLGGGNTAVHTQPRQFLECAGENLFIQIVESPARRGALLDPPRTNREELVKEVQVEGNVGDSAHSMIAFKILKGSELSQ